MRGLNLILYWIGFAFFASFLWQIALGKSSIDMLKEVILILMYAGLWEITIGNYFRNKEKTQQERVVSSLEA